MDGWREGGGADGLTEVWSKLCVVHHAVSTVQSRGHTQQLQ